MDQPKPNQKSWTLSLGNNGEGIARKALWLEAALKAMNTKNKRILNTWIREVLDAAAKRILKK